MSLSKSYTVSEGKMFFSNLALEERNVQVKFDLKLSVWTFDLYPKDSILVSWDGHQQPPREWVPKINKIVGF